MYYYIQNHSNRILSPLLPVARNNRIDVNISLLPSHPDSLPTSLTWFLPHSVDSLSLTLVFASFWFLPHSIDSLKLVKITFSHFDFCLTENQSLSLWFLPPGFCLTHYHNLTYCSHRFTVTHTVIVLHSQSYSQKLDLLSISLSLMVIDLLLF